MADEIINIWDLTVRWDEDHCFGQDDEWWPEDCEYRCPVCNAIDGSCMDIVFDPKFGVPNV